MYRNHFEPPSAFAFFRHFFNLINTAEMQNLKVASKGHPILTLSKISVVGRNLEVKVENPKKFQRASLFWKELETKSDHKKLGPWEFLGGCRGGKVAVD